jgi:hypothetical protein
MTMQFAAVHSVAIGTKRTCRDGPLIVGFWGKADIGRSYSLAWSDAIDPQRS